MAHVSWESTLDSSEWQRILSNETLDDNNVNATCTTNDNADATLSAPTWLLILLFALNGVAIVIAMASYAFLHTYRNRPIVAIGQTRLLRVLCVGALVTCIGNTIGLTIAAPSIWEDSSGKWVCSLYHWSTFLGLIIVFAIPLLKTYRVLKVSQFRRGVRVPPSYVFGPFAAIVLSGVGLLIAWEVLLPLKFYVYDFPAPNPSNETILSCVGYDNTLRIVFPQTQIAILYVLTIGILVLACKVRNVDKELGDSRRIFTSFLIIFICDAFTGFFYQSSLAGDIFGMGVMARYTVTIATSNFNVIYNAIIPVCCLIFPRMYYLWYEHKHGHLPEGVREFGRGGAQVTINGATNSATPPPTTTATNTVNDEVEDKDVDEEAKVS